jgi:hypothetical protein
LAIPDTAIWHQRRAVSPQALLQLLEPSSLVSQRQIENLPMQTSDLSLRYIRDMEEAPEWRRPR